MDSCEIIPSSGIRESLPASSTVQIDTFGRDLAWHLKSPLYHLPTNSGLFLIFHPRPCEDCDSETGESTSALKSERNVRARRARGRMVNIKWKICKFSIFNYNRKCTPASPPVSLPGRSVTEYFRKVKIDPADQWDTDRGASEGLLKNTFSLCAAYRTVLAIAREILLDDSLWIALDCVAHSAARVPKMPMFFSAHVLRSKHHCDA